MNKAKKKKETAEPVLRQTAKLQPNTNFAMALAGGTLFIFLLIWFQAYKPTVQDDWYIGPKLVDSSKKVADPVAAQLMHAKGGAILKAQLNKHPYHARIWFMYGYFMVDEKKWDSAILCEKKAIEMGKGASVNQVEYAASELLAVAVSQKINTLDQKDTTAIIKALRSAEVPGFLNAYLYRLSGIVYTNLNKTDTALYYLNRFYLSNKSDAEVAYFIGVNYARKGERQPAIKHLREALEIKKDYPAAKQLLDQIINSPI